MCLAIPGRILSIEGEDPAFRTAQVDFCGVQRTVNLAYTPQVLAGTSFWRMSALPFATSLRKKPFASTSHSDSATR
jgi:hypothetical protein